MVLDMNCDIRVQTEKYLTKKIRSIHYLVQDLPRGKRRARRGFLMDSHAKDNRVSNERRTKHSDKYLRTDWRWHIRLSPSLGRWNTEFSGSIWTQQADLDNVCTILDTFRNSIRDLQSEMVETRWDTSDMTLWAKNMISLIFMVTVGVGLLFGENTE